MLRIDQPLWLLGLLPLIGMICFYWKTVHAPFKRKLTAAILRCIIVVLLLFSVSGLHILVPVKDMTTIFVADVSDSAKRNTPDAVSFIEKAVAKKNKGDAYGVVVAGSESAIDTPINKDSVADTKLNTVVASNGTNLANGLRLAGAELSAQDRGHLILFTDGKETSGDAYKQLQELRRVGIITDIVPYKASEEKDMAVTGLEVPSHAFKGDDVQLSVTVVSNFEGDAELVFYEDGHPFSKEKVTVKSGENRLSFNHLVQSTGFHTYRVELVNGEDAVPENNRFSGYLTAAGEPRVLIVEGSKGEARNLSTAMEAAHIPYTVIPPQMLPTQLEGYLNYQSIIFSNVLASDVGEKPMEEIKQAVQNFGVGFIMTGGENSFGLGGYFETPIEDILPVDMQVKSKKKMPSLGLAIVIDRSGSMSGQKIALAREAAARSVRLLRPTDSLGVIAFDSRPWEVVPFGPIKKPKNAEDKIRTINAAGGTDIFPALKEAYEELKGTKLARKHIILLTDGESPMPDNYESFISEAKKDNITLSTVAVGQDAEKNLLDHLAKIGGGRFYDVQDPTTIPTIFSRETAMLTRTYIVNQPFKLYAFQGNEMSSLFQKGLPKMNSYIATTSKPRAEQLIASDKKDPILVRLPYGMGRTAAWTSDAIKWAGEWPGWESWPKLWADLVSWTFPRYEQSAYSVSVHRDGQRVNLDIQSEINHLGEGTLKAIAVNQDGKQIPVQIEMTAPGVYKGILQADLPGVYNIQLQSVEKGKVSSNQQVAVTVPYSDEYRPQDVSKDYFENLAEAGGGKVIDDPNAAFHRKLPMAYDRKDIRNGLLWIALLLFLVDVAYRKFNHLLGPFAPFLVNFNKRASQDGGKSSKGQVAEGSSGLSQVNQTIQKTRKKKEKETGRKGISSVRQISQLNKKHDSKQVNAKTDPKKNRTFPSENNKNRRDGRSSASTFEQLLRAKNKGKKD
ncbi:MAG: VWA domain-containing protein [Tuberibacillus sp.]